MEGGASEEAAHAMQREDVDYVHCEGSEKKRSREDVDYVHCEGSEKKRRRGRAGGRGGKDGPAPEMVMPLWEDAEVRALCTPQQTCVT